MKIGCVLVSLNYGDFLAHTLPENLEHFDHVVVVTHHSDHMTKWVCNKYSVEYVEAHCFDEDGDRFNKGRAIQIGISHLPKEIDWIVHIDADIVIPPGFRNLLKKHKLNKDYLYGVDRVNVFGFKKWCEVRELIHPHYKDHWFVELPDNCPVGSRIIHREHGWLPIGFFQMWHKDQNKKYPIHEGTAEHSDVLFAIQWHRKHRHLLPEVFVYHLESVLKQGKMGMNWFGRKSPQFCPCHQWNSCHPKPPPYKP